MSKIRLEFIKKFIVWCLAVSFLAVAVVSLLYALRWVNRPFAGFLIGKQLYVYDLSRPSWQYDQFKLKPRDRVKTVNDIQITTHKQFIDLIRSQKIGNEVTFRFARGGTVFTRKGKILKFSSQDLFIVFGSYYIIGIAFLIISMVVLVLKSGLSAARVFALFCFAVGIMLTVFFNTYSDSNLEVFFDIAWNSLVAIFIHLSMTFPRKQAFYVKRSWIIFIPYLFCLAVWQAKIYFGPRDFAVWKVIDQGFDVITLVAYLGFLSSLVITSIKASTSILRKRAQVALIGMFAFLAPAISLAFLSTGSGSSMNYSLVFTLMFPIYLGYAIIKHNLFDSERVIVNSIFYAIFTLLVVGLYISVSTVTSLLFSSNSPYQNYMASVISTIIIVASFSYLRSKFQRLVDKIFFQDQV